MKEIIKELIDTRFTCTNTRGKPVWKRGSRKMDNMKAVVVLDYIKSVITNNKQYAILAQIENDKQVALEYITELVTAVELETMAIQVDEEEINVNQFIHEWFDKLFVIDPITRNISIKGTIGNSYVNTTKASDIIMAKVEQTFNIPPKGFSIERVRRTIQNLCFNLKEESRYNSLEKINFSGEDDVFLTNWIEDLFALYKVETSELNITMFKHMLYSVKRAVFGLQPPECRYMYTFFNRAQGAGKTRFIKHTCEPFLSMYTDQGTIDMLTNKNDLKALTAEKLVIDIQELASEKEFNQESYKAMKSAITSDSVGGRVLYSTDSESQPMLSVFVSSTNIHIADMIRDETGLRRFYSFDFKNSRSSMNWKAVDKHWEQIYKVYQVIDENGLGYMRDDLDIHSQLEIVQEEYKRKSDFILDWQTFTGNKLVAKQEPKSRIIPKIELFTQLQNYCKTYESFNLKMGTMKNLLISRHSIYAKQDSNGSDYYYIIEGKGGNNDYDNNFSNLPVIEEDKADILFE